MRTFILIIFLSFPSHAIVKEHYIKFTLLTDTEQEDYRSKKIKTQDDIFTRELVEGKESFFKWCLDILDEGCCNKGWGKTLEKSTILQSEKLESMNTFWDEDISWKSYIHKKDLSFWFPELEATDDVKVDYSKGKFIFFGIVDSKQWLHEVSCNEIAEKDLALCSLKSSTADKLFNIPMKFEEYSDDVISLGIFIDEPLAQSTDKPLAHLLIQQRASMTELHSDESYFKQAEFGSVIQYERDWRVNYYKGECISYETFYFVPKKKKFIFLNHGIGRYGYCK
jgi:hypothetical protein